MRASFWRWLMLRLANVIIFCSKAAGILKIALCFFITRMRHRKRYPETS